MDIGPGQTNVSPLGKTVTLSEFSERVGLYPGYLVSLVVRYEFLEPERLTSGDYLFSEEDIAKVNQLQDLIQTGLEIRIATAIIYYDKEYKMASKRMFDALNIRPLTLLQWKELITTLNENAALEGDEQTILNVIEVENQSLLNALIALGLRTELEAREKLSKVHAKVGYFLMSVLQNMLILPINPKAKFQMVSPKIASILGLEPISETSWQTVIDVLSRNSELLPNQEIVFKSVVGENKTLLEIPGMRDIHQARAELYNVYVRIGFTILYLLKLQICEDEIQPSAP